MTKSLNPYSRYDPLPKSNSGVPDLSDDEMQVCQLEEGEKCDVSPQIQMENLYSLARVASVETPKALPDTTRTNVPSATQPLRITYPQESSDSAMVTVTQQERRPAADRAPHTHSLEKDA